MAKGTSVQTEVGMCGDYSGVVGMEYLSSLSRFLSGKEKTTINIKQRLNPATQVVTLSATLIKFDITNGLANSIYPIIMGDILQTQFDLK